MTASVVVVTWNGRHLLDDCLASLAAQVASDLAIEIIVVDNGSSDGTTDWLATAHPAVTVIALPDNLGFAGGANAGIRAATGEVVLLINNDATAEPGFVDAATRAVLADDSVAAVTGLIVLAERYSPATKERDAALVAADGSAWSADAGGIQLVNSTGNIVTRDANGLDRDWLAPLSELRRPSGDVAGFSGGAVALRRSAVTAVGLFDERYFMYYEDTDLAWRLRAAGWSIRFEREAVVRHRHAASSGTRSEFFLFHNERNRLLFAVRNTPVGVVVRAFARTILGGGRAVLRGDIATAGRRLRAVSAALRLAPGFARDRRRDSRAGRYDIAREYLIR